MSECPTRSHPQEFSNNNMNERNEWLNSKKGVFLCLLSYTSKKVKLLFAKKNVAILVYPRK